MKRSTLMIGMLCLAVLVPLVRCDGTILNEQVTLDSSNPTKSYFLNLAGGNTISISISVTGDLINFFIFNSTDGQLLSKYDIGGVDEQWAVPYSDRFEFHVETSGVQATVTITLSSAGGQNPPPQSNATLVDEQFSIDAQEVWSSYRDFRFNLTGGDRISISVSVDGSVILFAIYNSTETYEALLLERRDVTSVNEEWTAPYKDKFDFYLKIYEGTAQVHFTVQKVGGGGGGFDPTVLIVVVVVAAVAVVASFLILRMRKGSAGPPPPPTPPPPPP